MFLGQGLGWKLKHLSLFQKWKPLPRVGDHVVFTSVAHQVDSREQMRKAVMRSPTRKTLACFWYCLFFASSLSRCRSLTQLLVRWPLPLYALQCGTCPPALCSGCSQQGYLGPLCFDPVTTTQTSSSWPLSGSDNGYCSPSKLLKSSMT